MSNLCVYFLMFVTYSILGWIMEVVAKLVTDKKFVNRGFLIGPYCPIYGFGAIITGFFCVRYLDDPFTLLIMLIIVFCFLEYFTSYILEKVFNTRWWDYTDHRFNINGRICLDTMIPFGAFGMLLMYKINPFFYSLYSKIPFVPLLIISVCLLLILVSDFITSYNIIIGIKNIGRDTASKKLVKKDDTERITKLVKEHIVKSRKTFQKRIISAYPNFTLRPFKHIKKEKKSNKH